MWFGEQTELSTEKKFREEYRVGLKNLAASEFFLPQRMQGKQSDCAKNLCHCQLSAMDSKKSFRKLRERYEKA